MYKKNGKNLVRSNGLSGTPKVQAFKAIIEEAFFNDNHFSAGSMACAMRTFDALKKSDGTTKELIDLMLFYIECGSQFTIDYEDIDEDFYTNLEDTFEEVLGLIKENDSFLDVYKERLNAISQETHCVGWGYPDQIGELLADAFPDTFTQYSYHE